MEDDAIIELYLKRDEAAIRETAAKYGPRLRALSLGITGDEATAEECENDAYMEAWQSIPPKEPRGYFYAFLARIARHLSLNRCRERSRLKRSAFITELTAEMEECIPSPGDTERRIDEIALGEALNGFLGTLGEEKRNVFLRRYWYLDSVTDIARRFSLSESKIKTMLFRMRVKLREYLEKEGFTL